MELQTFSSAAFGNVRVINRDGQQYFINKFLGGANNGYHD